MCRFRHLLLDLIQLLPHSKKDAKLDTKSDRGLINEVADMKGCTSVIFFEARKHKDLYVWLAKSPNGPCVKFHVTNSECAPCGMANNAASANNGPLPRQIICINCGVSFYLQSIQWQS